MILVHIQGEVHACTPARMVMAEFGSIAVVAEDTNWEPSNHRLTAEHCTVARSRWKSLELACASNYAFVKRRLFNEMSNKKRTVLFVAKLLTMRIDDGL